MAPTTAIEKIANRIRAHLQALPGCEEKRMFGGLCFLLNGNMCCGETKEARLLVRAGPDACASALLEPHVAEMDFTGRPLKGIVYIDTLGIESDEQLGA